MINISHTFFYHFHDAPPHSSKDSNASPKVKTREEKRVGICSLVHNILKVEGHV
jgi:hypothetical protein